jgi:hypothetical protein
MNRLRLTVAAIAAAILASLTVAAPAGAASDQGHRAASQIPQAVNGPKITRSFRAAVNTLPVRTENRAGYVRTKFKLWDDVNHDCQDARSEVLRQETKKRVTGSCAVKTGRWVSQYDGVVTTKASSFDIDHLVPLAEVWDSGARAWTPAKREAYANDLTDRRTLIAVSASSNRSKGDRDPAEWLPDQRRCLYVFQWTIVKTRWSLSVDATEKAVLQQYANACPNSTFTTYAARVKLVGKKASTGGGGGNGGGGGGNGGGKNCTPGYSPCLPPMSDYDCANGSGNGPGYAYGPIYVSGSDPYDLDQDGDGVACEN